MNATTDNDVKAIKILGKEYFEATNVGDADGCIAMMAPDVIIMPPNRPSIVGAEQLRRLSHEYHSTFELKYTSPTTRWRRSDIWDLLVRRLRARAHPSQTAGLKSWPGGTFRLLNGKPMANGSSGESCLTAQFPHRRTEADPTGNR